MASASSSEKQTVAVIGLGAMGIVAVKNMLEEGFDVSGFERNAYFGGLWHYTDNKDTLSVLNSTITNVTTDRGGFTDYPFPEGTPNYCTGQVVEDYLHRYVDHFGLRPRFHLSAKVTAITYMDDTEKWKIDFSDAPSKYFDKVVMATGPHPKPLMPNLEGADLFAGQIVHSMAFKNPEEFRDKRVVVLGLGNTGGDIVDALVGVASNVYISHNRGSAILPRMYKGLPASRTITQRSSTIRGIGEKYFPNVMEKIVQKKLGEIMRGSFGELDPSWGLEPIPPMEIAVPVVSDTLIGHLRTGGARSISGIDRIAGPSELALKDGSTVDADVVICCTGYKNDFSLLDPRFDPSADPPASWVEAPGSRGRPFPRLYQNVFSIKHPGSLAFLGCAWYATAAFCLADMVSMAIAQVWTGKSSLPPTQEMQRWADNNARRMSALAQKGTPLPALVEQRDWLLWLDATAGMGVFDNLGWGWTGWRFWWTEREMYSLLMDGVVTSSIWRFFDTGKRKPWEGARDDIINVNKRADEEARRLREDGADGEQISF